MAKEWFEDWFTSPYADILYENRNDKEADFFLTNLINYLKPEQGCRILDAACGEGRFSVLMAKNKYEVIGIDLAENRINTALQHEKDNLHFYVQDMREPFRINYFNYVFNFFTSFGYFEKYNDNVLAAKAFAVSLVDGGSLLIDYLNYEKIIPSLVPEDNYEKNGILFSINRKIEGNKIVKNICVTDNGHQHFYQEKVTAFSLEDFKDLFTAQGLHLRHVFGDYHLNDFDHATSPRMIMIFDKK